MKSLRGGVIFINGMDVLMPLLREAQQMSATDVHFLLQPSSEKVQAQYRAHGTIFNGSQLSYEAYQSLLRHLKFSASLDIGEERRPQSGSYTIMVKSQPLDLRISTLPGIPLEHLTIRILSSTILPFEKLSIFPTAHQHILPLLNAPHGLFLLCGPTGAGKTTTLYALLKTIQKTTKKRIITLEDPVEQQIEGVVQLQINEAAGFHYEEGLRSVMRHDPDVIVISEIRDALTAKWVIRASMTGHLVLSTIHGSHPYSAARRFLEYGIQLLDLEESLLGILSQRLATLATANRLISRPRAAVFDLAIGQAWKRSAAGEGLAKELRKAYAYGFITENEWRRWFPSS
ncbi:Flp pilus assembly complex ATPase component TadA [Bacillaceae bacterium SIJ1]|uniref:ATPase, T2SS/T4P/T4SS family n=1 Tax=Litoribacterium kuwaitense TaxID=1398745 RepID=UPI0013EAED00|nr:ATPase, T2SS/T4P/T4SS family [Litoribacterium kuwaitense]NGP43573.1 Flp pilus assembly complex ATPase component TadA [Litoribacterium kuwaitense]